MNLKLASNYIKKYIGENPKVCIVLGSGLNYFAKNIEDKIVIPYNDVPSFYQTSVEGHVGEFIYGKINNIPILCGKGRFHHYEGYSFDEVGSIIKIFNYFKPSLCIITNSSGCLDLNWPIGSLMLSNQIIDFSFIKSHNPIKHRFNKSPYFELAVSIAKKNNINLFSGSYTYTTGPSYETPAEISEIISLGGKAVGMSTFPEYLKCIELNLDFIIISCLTNYGAGLVDEKIKHKDVLENANKTKKIFSDYISEIIRNIGPQKKQKK